jgi:23S rRNA (guanosine2251-2'-O)-methyltransferase
VETVDNHQLDALAGSGHQGFAAEAKELSAGSSAADPDLIVLIEDLQDPRNLGALLRVCEGAGVGRVLIRDRGSAPISPTVVQTSAGATEWLEVERIINTTRELEMLKEDGFWIYGAAEEGVAPWTVDLTGKAVLCFGGEEKGLRPRTRTTCDALVGLPMRGRIESLNVATAAAALLYEAVRQRDA